MATRATVAAVIPVFNVEHVIKPTLESVKWCDEIIVVDMYSTDETRAICASYPNCRFFQRRDYIFGNFNYGVEQAATDWIIRLDSDEVIRPELRNSIDAVLSDADTALDGYTAQVNLYFFGYRLRYGYGKDSWRCILFRKGCARYEVRSEHEAITTQGSWGRLQGRYDHFTNPTISAWIDKINYYTDRDVEREPDAPPMSMFKIVYRTLRWFQRQYLYPYQAFRDGVPGFVTTCVGAAGLMIMYFKQWERAARRKRGSDYVAPHPNA